MHVTQKHYDPNGYIIPGYNVSSSCDVCIAKYKKVMNSVQA